LEGCRFDRADFTGANLNNTNLNGTGFIRCILVGTKFNFAKNVGQDPSRVDFHNAKLTGAEFNSADLAKPDFQGADLTGAVLVGAKLLGATFHQNAVLVGARFDKTDLTEAVFNADISGASFVGTKLIRARIEYTKLVDAHINRADFLRATFTLNNTTTPKNIDLTSWGSEEAGRVRYLQTGRE